MPETLVSLAGLPDERDVPPADKTIEPGKDNIGTINARLSKLPAGATCVIPGRTRITVDAGTPTLRRIDGWTLTGEYPESGFQTMTDTGGLDPPQARTRAHLLIDRCRHWKICKMTVSGTHPSDGRDRSPTLDPSYWKLDDDRTNDGWPTRNIWEAQAGIDIIGEDEIDGTVWDLRAHGGTWSRLGRCAATAYVSDFEWDATVVKRRASDVYHLEMGGNPRLAVENHTVRGIIDLESDPGRFATLASGAGMANITLEQNIARTFEVFVNGDPGPDGKPLARNLRVLGNESAETVRSFLRAFTVAGVDVRNNKAPIYARNNPYSYNGQKGLQLEGCPGPNITTPNRFTYV
jgi:hypothetical protein